jgi:hypothetical protein
MGRQCFLSGGTAPSGNGFGSCQETGEGVARRRSGPAKPDPAAATWSGGGGPRAGRERGDGPGGRGVSPRGVAPCYADAVLFSVRRQRVQTSSFFVTPFRVSGSCCRLGW